MSRVASVVEKIKRMTSRSRELGLNGGHGLYISIRFFENTKRELVNTE